MTSTVTDKYIDAKEWLTKLFEQREIAMNGQKSHPLHQFRRKAIERLENVNFPTRRDEDWKYTSVKKVLDLQYQEGSSVEVKAEQLENYTLGDLDTYQVVFVNGHFRKDLSSKAMDLPEGIVFEEMIDALTDEKTSAIVEEYLTQWSTAEENAFVVLNAAFAMHGLFIHVPANVVVDKPFHIINLSAPGSEPILMNPQLLVSAGTSSEVSIIESYYQLNGSRGSYFNNVVSRFRIEANAHVYHYKLQREGLEAFQINDTEVLQQKDSTYSSFAIDLGGSLVRNNISSVLQGENTSTNYYGVYLAKGKQHIDTQTFIDHALPHCVSNELYKGIITDRAKGVFNGKVIVRQDAQKTNAFQQNSSLLLSPYATMDSKPQLEIFADDVRCSHGATIGQLDESAVYYLRTRGLTDEKARSMLQHAFLQEVIENIPIGQVRDWAEVMIHEKFEEKIK